MKQYGLIGHPLSHSFSQQYFTAKFASLGLDGHHYGLYPLEHITDLPDLIVRTPGISGLNVTAPHKRSVMELLDELHPVASAVGAVNTIAFREGRRVGYNTDVDGFRYTLLPLIGSERPRALVLGSGGACRAVVFVLKELGIRFRVVSRSHDRGDLTWDQLDPTIVKACPLLINTTPVGTYPSEDEAPLLPYEALGPRHMLIDLIYNPSNTRYLRNGAAQGARTVNGLAMLHAQADGSWRIWQQVE